MTYSFTYLTFIIFAFHIVYYIKIKKKKKIPAEISARPDDMNLRLKLLKLYESSDRLFEAFSYATNIEKTSMFQKYNVEWYEAVSRICEVSIINYKY